jgi:TolA-binding protein
VSGRDKFDALYGGVDSMDRQTRRDLKHDKFVDEVGALGEMVRSNARNLALAGAGALVLMAIIGGYFYYRSNREQSAQTRLGEAIATMDSPLKVDNQQIPNARFKTDAERSAAAEQQFKAVNHDYAGTDAADVADLYLARLAASRGDLAAARPKLQAFIDSHSKVVLASSARYSLYQLRIDNGEAAKVTAELEQQLAGGEQLLPPDSILSLLARAYQAQGNTQKTKETFRRIVTEYPDSPYALDAQRQLPPA